jgi:hypothetical protein
VHVIHADRDGIGGIEVVSHPAAHHESEREVLALSPNHPLRAFGVDPSHTKAPVEVGDNSPVRPNKIAANPHVVRAIPRLRSPGDRGEGSAKSQVPVSAENGRAPHIVQLPSQRSNRRYQRVLERSLVISTA